MTQFSIRHYRPGDLDALAGIYQDSIRVLGPGVYSAAQIEAWSGFAEDSERFREWIEGAATLVAVAPDDEPIAFGGLVDAAHVSSLFVAPAGQRQGIGLALLDRLLCLAKNQHKLTAHASEFSRPLFEKRGFVVSEVEHTVVKGVAFSRYAMQLLR